MVFEHFFLYIDIPIHVLTYFYRYTYECFSDIGIVGMCCLLWSPIININDMEKFNFSNLLLFIPTIPTFPVIENQNHSLSISPLQGLSPVACSYTENRTNILLNDFFVRIYTLCMKFMYYNNCV